MVFNPAVHISFHIFVCLHIDEILKIHDLHLDQKSQFLVICENKN